MADERRETLLTVSSWPRTLHRNDVVVRKGKLTLLNEGLSPQDAMVADLLFVREALEAADIPFMLVRGDDRPVIVVDWKRRADAVAALAAAATSEPLYAKAIGPRSSRALFVADGRLSTDPKSRVFRLYRPRIEPVGRLRYGSKHGAQLEFWSFKSDRVVAPLDNAMTRTVIPREEIVETTVEVHGRQWRTIEPMFTRLARDIPFEIDIVFSWVDGTDVEFRRARAKRMASYVVGEGDDAEARYRQIDELRYALRSVHLYAPWIRNIFIATDSPRPEWLDDHPRVRIVRSEEFFADTSVLPTHNSHAIEASLHRIDGLSEHFLYSNDDMFFGRPVSPDMFFSPGGVSKFVEATTRIGLGVSEPFRSGFENAARVNRALLQERFGATIVRHLEHSPAPLRRSVMAELEREFPDEFKRTISHAFRSSTDISVTNSFYHYYALLTGRAVEQETARVRYIDTTTHEGLASMLELLESRDQDFFCLNDGSFPEVGAKRRAQAVRSFLERYYSFPAPWERSENLTSRATG